MNNLGINFKTFDAIRHIFENGSEYWSARELMEINAWAGSNLETYLNGTYSSSLNQSAKDMIVEGTWNAGATSYDANANTAYTASQATQVTRRVGLLATYEYLSAAGNSCLATAGNGGVFNATNGCASQDWLKLGSVEWTMSPNSGYSSYALLVNSIGLNYTNVYSAYGVRPAVYLKSSVKIRSGTGESGSPYVLE